MSRYQDYLEQFDVSGVVIDVGGSAKPIKGRTKSWKVKRYFILDNNLEKKVKEDIWNEPDLLFDLNTDEWGGETADWVFCIAVFNYIWNPAHAIKQIYKMLKGGGRAVISFSLIYPHSGILEADSLRYTKAGIVNLLKYAGFKNWKIDTVKSKNLDLLMRFYQLERMHINGQVDNSEISFRVCAKK